MNLPKETAELLEAYFAGDPSPDTLAAMEAWLSEDPAHPRVLAEYGLIDRLISHEQKKQDASAIISVLLESEAEAKLALPTMQFTASSARSQSPYVSALSYIVRHTFTPKRVALLATAAVFLLGVVIAIVMLTEPADNGRITVATDPPAPVVEEPSAQRVVATLTAERDAVWDRQPGENLFAGQRLTLSQGFAEITTKRGAIAILEAPVTIEMIDSPNALRLHVGKLVGICEITSSKGLLIRTPHTDITDLGTEFGVEVHPDGHSVVYVFDGLVEVLDPINARQVEVPAGTGRRVDKAGRTKTFSRIDTAATFVRSVKPEEHYGKLVLSDKPLLYYRMDDLADGLVRNAASDRYHASVFGSPSVSQEDGNAVLSLRSRGEYLKTSVSINELRAAETYTMECWIRPSHDKVGSICMLATESPTSQVGVDTASRFELTGEHIQLGVKQHIRLVHLDHIETHRQQTRDDANELYSAAPYTLGRWMHVAAVRHGDKLTLYIDGQKASETDVLTPLLDRDLFVTIGRFSTESTGLDIHDRQYLGEIDELAIYDYGLSAERVMARFKAGQAYLSKD